MSKQKRTRVDVLILCVILLLIAGAFVKIGIRADASGKTEEFTYTMEISSAPDKLESFLHIGDTVWDNAGKAPIGTISSVESGTQGLRLCITAQGTGIDGGYRVGVYNVTPGYCGKYFTKYAIWDGTVTEVD